jgi:hypothetical protein
MIEVWNLKLDFFQLDIFALWTNLAPHREQRIFSGVTV